MSLSLTAKVAGSLSFDRHDALGIITGVADEDIGLFWMR
jgi:hypothetical protein